MSGSSREDWQRVDAIEDELYGVKRNNGIVGKVRTMWEAFLMAKGILWFIIKTCAVLIPLLALLYAWVS